MPNKDDRVVCIDDNWSLHLHALFIPRELLAKMPVKDSVYYIAGADSFPCSAFCMSPHAFYRLVGFPNAICFDARNFRPVIEDEQRTKTQVEELISNALPVKAPEKVS